MGWALIGVLAMVDAAAAAAPNVTAQAAVLMDAATGELIWSKNPDVRRAPASTTKILTTMIALESGRLDDEMQVSPYAASQAPSKLYLRAGQRVALRDLLYALMLKSANDGAVVVAEGLGGTVDQFAARMNARAARAGARNSTFRNPSGLPNSQHLSTARDLGMILRDALDVPGFRRVVETKSRSIVIQGSKPKPVSLHTKNRLLSGYFVPVIGKTGFTRAAGRCFAGAASLGDREVIVVVLGANDMWGDTRKLLEWALRGEGGDTWPNVQMARVRTPPPAAPKAPAAVETVRVAEDLTPPRAVSKASYARTVAATAPARPVPASAPARTVTARAPARSLAASATARSRSAAPARPAVHSLPASSTAPRAISTDPPAAPPLSVAAQAWDSSGVRRGCSGAGCGSGSSRYGSR